MHDTRAEPAPAFGAGLPQFRPFSMLSEVPPEPEWLWEGLLAVGQLTMLVAPPFAGKSTLVFGLLGALQDGAPFLGRKTSRAGAVLLTEENNQQLHEKALGFGVMDAGHYFLGRNDGVLAADWETLIAHATATATQECHRLLVIDTFPTLAGLETEEENDAGAIVKRLRPLVNAAGQGLAVLFLHHTNKYGGIRGSQAFAATVDINIQLRRPNKRTTITLDAECRGLTDLPAKLTAQLHQSPDGWFYTAAPRGTRSATDPAVRGTDQLLEEALRRAGPAGLTYRNIGEIPGLSRDKAKKRLPQWEAQKRIRHQGSGTKADPIRWMIASPR